MGIKFDLVSPERRLASMEAERVQIPGMAGDLTALENHAPFLTTLRPGVVKAEAAGGAATEYVVTGGFAEISPTTASVLAEVAIPRSEATQEWIAAQIDGAEKALEVVAEDGRMGAQQLIMDFKALAAQLG